MTPNKLIHWNLTWISKTDFKGMEMGAVDKYKVNGCSFTPFITYGEIYNRFENAEIFLGIKIQIIK